MKDKKIVTSIGGQAIIEGIMMRGPQKTSVAVSVKNGEIYTEMLQAVALRDKYKFFAWPLLRGIAAFVDSIRLGQKALKVSMQKSLEDDDSEEEQTKFEKWLEEKVGDKLMPIIMTVSMIIGTCFSVLLFMAVPTWLFNISLSKIHGWNNTTIYRAIFEGIMRMVILFLYLLLCSQMKDIKRVFKYHGAEHKAIACYESMEELTTENVRKHSRFHPRCGTSFMVIMIMVGVVISFFIPIQQPILRTIVKLMCAPVLISMGYELIKLCGKHDNKLTRGIAAPGMWMQRITTKEPDDEMIKVAIQALELVLPENGEDRI